jgi:hypothetical protein
MARCLAKPISIVTTIARYKWITPSITVAFLSTF